MRTIKFRAWNGERMIFMGRGGYCDFSLSFGDIYQFDNCGYTETKKDYPLMQYTGLKDKNGVEIYEGDLVNLPTDGEFNITEIAFTVDRDFNGWEITPQHIEDGAEIIGNIHENPELIGGSDE